MKGFQKYTSNCTLPEIKGFGLLFAGDDLLVVDDEAPHLAHHLKVEDKPGGATQRAPRHHRNIVFCLLRETGSTCKSRPGGIRSTQVGSTPPQTYCTLPPKGNRIYL